MAADSCSLSKEKVWADKSSYDKAECLYQERLGKDVLPVKPLMSDDSPSGGNNPTKKAKKAINKQNNTTMINNDTVLNSTETPKSNKKKNKKKEAKAAEALPDNGAIKSEDSELSQTSMKETPTPTTTNNKKLKAKEAKEEKNKADKKQKNADEDKSTNIIEENKNQETSQGGQFPTGSLASEVAKARAHIKQSLQCMDGIAALAGLDSDFSSRVVTLEKQNQDLRNTVQELKNIVTKLDNRVKELEGKCGSQGTAVPQIAVCPAKKPAPAKPAPKKEEKKEEKDDDEDIDLFGSDSEGEDAEAEKVRQERVAAYAAKKSKKPAIIAKSSIILDVKPWDDETDMKALEDKVREITMDGLLWGASKLVPVAYNIKKLQINCVVEDDKVSIDALTEQIEEIEDFVQSVDIAAFNKI